MKAKDLFIRVLVVDDERSIRRFLDLTLSAHGFHVLEASTLAEARRAIGLYPQDLILLDLGLPDGQGVDLILELRAFSRVPIIVLSARDREMDKVDALDAGADDYLTKPFGTEELLARMRVALRHAKTADGRERPRNYAMARRGYALEVDLEGRSVRSGPVGTLAEVALTPTEFRLLQELAVHAGKVLTHAQLLRSVWGAAHDGDIQYLRVYMSQLRKKIEADPTDPRFLRTELGIGYRLVAESEG